MNTDKMTIKTQELIQSALNEVNRRQQQQIEALHLLKAAIDVGESLVDYLLQKNDISKSHLLQEIEKELSLLPKVSGGEAYLSREATEVLRKAEDNAAKDGDQYITIDSVFLALLQVKTAGYTLTTSPVKTPMQNAIR